MGGWVTDICCHCLSVCDATARDRGRIDRRLFRGIVAPVPPPPSRYTTGVSKGGGVRNNKIQTFSKIVEMFFIQIDDCLCTTISKLDKCSGQIDVTAGQEDAPHPSILLQIVGNCFRSK